MTTEQRRLTVTEPRDAASISERRACRYLGVPRSTIQYRSRRSSSRAPRVRSGSWRASVDTGGAARLHVFFEREGWEVNHRRGYRLYLEEGLMLKRWSPKRRKAAANRKAPSMPAALNQRSDVHFVHDTLAGSGKLQRLPVLDIYIRGVSGVGVPL